MHYTPCCGAEALHPNKSKHQCSNCGKTYYDNPKAAEAIVLVDENRNLIVGRRAHQPHRGKIDFPGGFLDVGENFETAAYRELKEESGLSRDEISELRYIGSVHDYYPWEGEEISVTSVYYLARLKPGRKLKAADDMASYETASLESIKKGQIAWSGAWEILEMIKTQNLLDTL